MKYLTVIYYDTFARFFCAIEDAVKKLDPSAEFLHLAIFPSGYLYMRIRGRRVRLLPWEVRTRRDATASAAPEELDRIARYHAVVCSGDGSDATDALRLRAQHYVNANAHILEEFDPDVVIFSGDTRIACEALKFQLDSIRHRAKRFYFEQGPNGTTIFDTRGVNAHCSFRETAAALTGEGISPETVVGRKKFRSNPLYRGMDYALIAVLRLLRMVPSEWETMSLKRYPRKAYRACIDHGRASNAPQTREILVALQVPDDANNIHHNPLGLGDAELVQMVMQASAGLPVRVREHPLYRRRYTAALYEMLASSQSVLLSDATLIEDLAKAAVVVTVNSMTGLDAYLRGIPAILLGNAFYDHLPGVVRAHDLDSLHKAIADLSAHGMTSRLRGRHPASIFAEMRAKHFVPGHYLDAMLTAPDAIAALLVRRQSELGASR